MGDPNTFKPELEGKCPCGGTFTAGYDGEDVPGVMHTEPACERFSKLEPDEFLRYVRRSAGIVAPWDNVN